MQKQLYTITENRLVATDTYRLSFSGSVRRVSRQKSLKKPEEES